MAVAEGVGEEESEEAREARVEAALFRFELESREAKLSFVAAALAGAELTATAVDDGLGKAIGKVCLEVLAMRMWVRQELRGIEAPGSTRAVGKARRDMGESAQDGRPNEPGT